jgi:FkbM family methyltransferase
MLANSVRTTDTRYGEMSYYAGDNYIGRSLELYGEYSPDEVRLWRKFVKPCWRVVNGGANIGALAIPLADLVGTTGKVYAFEPQPEAFELLQRNASSWEQIEIFNLALWHSRGDSKMRLYEELKHDNFGCTRIGDLHGSAEIRMVALDDQLPVDEHIDFIFLDIEGSEVMALEGAKKTIERCRPVLYVEDDGQSSSSLSTYLRQKGYYCYQHKPDMFSPENWKKCPENIFLKIEQLTNLSYQTLSFNLLCIPKERIEEFRDVVNDHTKYHDERAGTKLKMVVSRSPSQGASGWAAISRCGGVGDNLIAASVCKPLKEMGYKVEVITQTPNDVVFENNPHIDKISVYDAKDWPQEVDKWQDWFRLRAREYERFANFAHSVEFRHALFPIQTWYWWPQEYRRKICGGNYLETAHDVMGVPHSFGPLFYPTDEEKEQAAVTRRKLGGSGPIIGWCLSGTRIDKVYPYSQLVIGRLIKELGAQVVMMGAPPPHRDAEIAKVVMENVKAQNGTLDGLTHAGSPSLDNQTWPVRRILTFAAVCDLYIGFDTGPSWAVAFEPIPKIIMVSHTSVENITKHWINTTTLHGDPKRVPCWPCHRLHNTFETCNPIKVNDTDFAACISDINAEDIISNAARLLRAH